MIRFLIILLLLTMSCGAFDTPLDSYFNDDVNDNDEVYNPTVGDKKLALVIYYPPAASNSGTLTISPDPQGIGSIAINDNDNNGYYTAAGVTGDHNIIYTDGYTDGNYTITVNVSGQTEAQLVIKLDSARPTLSNMKIINTTKSNREDYYEPGDVIKVEIDITDSNIDITGIQADITKITNNGADAQAQPDTFVGTKATWSRTAADTAEGIKQVSVKAIDKAKNEYSGSNGNKTITCDKTAPWAVTLLTPLSGYHTTEVKPTFSWEDLGTGSDEVKYVLYIDDSTDFSSPIVQDEVANADATYNHQISTSLNVGHTYWWKVHAFDALDHKSPASEIRTIMLDTPPAPQVSSHTPTSNQTGVALDTSISIEFSKAMNKTTVETAFSLKKLTTGVAVPGVFIWSNADKTLTFTPNQSLSPSSTYTVNIASTALSADGVNLMAPLIYQFSTRSISSVANATVTPHSCFPNTDIAFTFRVTPTLDASDTGIQKAYLTIPTGFNYVSVESITPSGASILDGDTLVITLDTLMTSTNQTDITVLLTLHSLSANGPAGVSFTGRLDNNSSSNPLYYTEAASGDLKVVIQDYYATISGEVNPPYLKPGGFSRKVVHTIKPTFNSTDSGIDQIRILCPYSASTSNVTLRVNGVAYQLVSANPAAYQFTVNYTGGALEFHTGTVIKTNGPVETQFYVTTPGSEDVTTGGVRFSYQVKNSLSGTWKPDPATNSPEGDADSNNANSNKLTVMSGYPCSSSAAELTPLSVNANVATQAFTAYVRPMILSSNIGIDKVTIQPPASFTGKTVSSVKFCDSTGTIVKNYAVLNSTQLYPPSNTAYFSVSSGTLIIIMSPALKASDYTDPSSYLKIDFTASTPTSGDSGSAFTIACDSKFEEAQSPINSSASDIDGDGSGSLTVQTLAAVNQITGEIVPCYAKPSTKKEYNYYIQWQLDPSVNTGIDKIELSSVNHTVNTFKKIYVNGSEDTDFGASVTGGKLILTRGTVLNISATVRIVFDATASSQPDSGYKFTVKVDNSASSNPVEIMTAADLDSNPGNSDTMNVKVGYPVSPGKVVAELSVSPKATSAINTVAPENVIDYTYGIKAVYATPNFGYDLFTIVVPPHHKNVDISSTTVKLDGTLLQIVSPGSLGEGKAAVSLASGLEGGTISVQLGAIQQKTSLLEVTFKAETPQITTGLDDAVIFSSYADYSKALIPVQAVEGEATANINGSQYSLTVTTVVVPASNVLVQIAPDSVNVNESAKDFTLEVTPQFKVSDTGVDTVQLKIPSALSINTATFKIYVNNVEQTSAYVRTILNVSTYEVSITGFERLTFVNSGTVKIEFKADTGTVAYTNPPLQIGISVDDSADGKNRVIRGPDAEVKIKGCAGSAYGYIYPNITSFAADTQYRLGFDYKIKSPDDHGFSKIEILLPGGFAATSLSSGVKVYKTGTLMSANDYSAEVSTGAVYVSLKNKETADGSMEVYFNARSPSINVISTFEAKISDSSEVYISQRIAGKTASSFNVQVQSATINSGSVEVVVKSGTAGYWKMNVVVPFNIKMNGNYGKMKAGSYELKKESFNVEGNYSVYRGFAYIAAGDISSLAEKVDIVFTYGRDYSGQDVQELKASSVPVVPGVKLGAFFNPLLSYEGKVNDAQLLIGAVASREITEAQIACSARESTGTSTAVSLTRLYEKTKFTGSYFLKPASNGSVEITVTLTDRYGTKNTERTGIVAVYLSPARNYAYSYDRLCKITENVNAAKRVVIAENSVETAQRAPGRALVTRASYFVGGVKNAQISYTGECSEKTGWYKDGKYMGPASGAPANGSASYVLADDNFAPAVELAPGEYNTSEPVSVAVSDPESGINPALISVCVNGRVIPHSYADNTISFMIADGISDVTVNVSDFAGNKTVQRAVMRASATALLTKVRAYPVPADTEITFRYSTAAQKVQLKIYDVNGDIIYTRHECATGNNCEEIWDLYSNSGKEAASGVYYYVIKASSDGDFERFTGKIVITR